MWREDEEGARAVMNRSGLMQEIRTETECWTAWQSSTGKTSILTLQESKCASGMREPHGMERKRDDEPSLVLQSRSCCRNCGGTHPQHKPSPLHLPGQEGKVGERGEGPGPDTAAT